MNRNVAMSLIVVLAVAVAVLGTLYYQQREQEHRVDIKLGGSTLSIQKKP